LFEILLRKIKKLNPNKMYELLQKYISNRAQINDEQMVSSVPFKPMQTSAMKFLVSVMRKYANSIIL
jgi:hypothetical protein